MTFTSLAFALFLPLCFLIYYFIIPRKRTCRNFFLAFASAVFYGAWDWRFLGLIGITILSSFFLALNPTRLRTATNIILNLLILVTFKYYGFFSDGLRNFLNIFGWEADWVTLDILLPVGISFYTFQAISYSVDCYCHRITPTRDFTAFSCYILFFPQLVAGPIERSTSLLPQFLSDRNFDYQQASIGMRQILWGLFKKLAVADLAGIYVDRILDSTHYYGGSTVLLAFILFSFQIYGDFSGYSDIAIGTARLFNIRLNPNFRYPFFSTTIRDFWRRWHISLMEWFKVYVYIPLGGSQCGKPRTLFNIFLVFILSGLWHGADITFLLWGAYCGLTAILSRFMERKGLSTIPIVGALVVFGTFAAGMILFRSPDMAFAVTCIDRIFSTSFLEIPTGITPLFFIAVMLAFEWCGRGESFPLEKLAISRLWRWVTYALLFYMAIFAADTDTSQFIYFQF